MSDFEDRYLVMPIINKINDAVTTLSHPVTVGVADELFAPLGPGHLSQVTQSRNNAPTVRLAPTASSSFAAEALISSL